jgi:hypothetical protein
LAVAAILFIEVNWPLWSDKPLIMRDVEDDFNLVSTKIISVAVLALFLDLVAKFTVCDIMLSIISCFFWLFSQRQKIFMSPQIKNPDFELYRYFNVISNLFIS